MISIVLGQQIPGPLSEDVEKDKKAKIAERKRMLKKSKKERLKVCITSEN